MVDALVKKFGYKNIMEVPKLDKIVMNMGVGEAKENAKLLVAVVNWADHRPESCNYKSKKIHCELQTVKACQSVEKLL